MKLFLSRKWGCLMLLPLAASLYAQKDLKTRATQVGIDERGYYQSIQVNGEQILGEMQPGQPGGSDWSWTTPYPGRFAVRLKVEGDGQELQRSADGGSGRRGADAGRNFGCVVLLQPDQRRCPGRSDPVHDAGRTGNG